MRHLNVALFVPHEGCPHRCSFCDQWLISGQDRPPSAEDVERAALTALRSPRAMDCTQGEIAFFGGSFTAVNLSLQEELLQAAQPFIRRGQFRGIRISTRPDAIDVQTIERLKRFGVTAVELGAQSMSDGVLIRNKRGHTAADTICAASLIRQARLELGLQMMTGLPGDTPEGAVETARALLALQPQTVRIYPAIVLEGTRLAAWYRAGDYRPQTLEQAQALCAQLLLLFHAASVPVIRLGLHAGGNVEEGFVAGPYHPAFRELCEGRIYIERAYEALGGISAGRVTLFVPPRGISPMAGQKKCNLEALRAAGYLCRIRPDGALLEYEVRALPGWGRGAGT